MHARSRAIGPLLAAGLAWLSGMAIAQAPTPERAPHQQQALQALHHFGRGYAHAALQSAEFRAAQAPASGTRRTVKLVNGDVTVTRDGTRWLIYGLRLTSAELQELGPAPGSPVSEVLSIYGPPEKTLKDRLVYPGVMEICSAHISFLIDKGQLRGVQWDWCYD
jgi:hypothetical protein